MNIIFFGTSLFSKVVIETLWNNNISITGVVTRKMKPKGRGKLKMPTPVSIFCREKEIEVYEVENFNSREFEDWIMAKKPEIFLLASFGKIIPKKILDMVKLPLNIHPSLLPKYRGASPIRSALMNNEQTTGITIFRMTEKMDAGDIIHQHSIDILSDEVGTELEQRLAKVGGEEFVKIYNKLKKGEKIRFIPQDESLATYTHKIKKEDLQIQWDKRYDKVAGKIRGLAMEPGAYTYFRGKRIKLLRALPYSTSNEQPGKIIEVSKEGIITACKEGTIIIKLLQIEGKKAITALDFLNGYKVKKGEFLKEV